MICNNKWTNLFFFLTRLMLILINKYKILRDNPYNPYMLVIKKIWEFYNTEKDKH